MKRLCLWLIWLCSIGPLFSVAVAQSRTLQEAELVLGPAMPQADAPWRPVTLPYVFSAQDYEVSREGWFRLTVDEADFQRPALLFPKVNMNIEVYLNGTLVGSGGRFSEPVTRNWNRPLMFAIPPGLQEPAGELLVHLISYEPYGQLGVVEYGETQALQPVYDRIRWNNNVIMEIMFYVTFVAGIWGGMLWLQRPGDTINLWYSLGAICWSMYSLNMFIVDIPVSAHVWDAMQFASFNMLSVMVIGVIHRLLALSRPRLEKCLLGYAGSGLLFNLVVDTATMNQMSVWWHLGAVGLVFYMTFLVVVHFHNLDSLSRWALSLFFFSAIMVSIHDLLYQNGATFVLPWRLFPYPAPILLVFFFWLLVKRFVMAMNEAESLSHQLDQRVEDNRIELEKNYRELQQAEMRRVIEKERQDIQDRFHREVGGTLHLLAQSGQEKVTGAIATVMAELRLAVNDKLPAQGRLAETLRQWQQVIESRVITAGAGLAWHVEGIGDDISLSRQQYAHLNRILNEAVSNAVKHAHASHVSVGWEYRGGELELRIEDRGKPAQTAIIPGRGVKGMQARAGELGGSINWYPSSTGCLVLLKIPCYHPASTQSPVIS